jgi:hypothetical protein
LNWVKLEDANQPLFEWPDTAISGLVVLVSYSLPHGLRGYAEKPLLTEIVLHLGNGLLEDGGKLGAVVVLDQGSAEVE